jgi:lipopolysaccharide transport system permease protein
VTVDLTDTVPQARQEAMDTAPLIPAETAPSAVEEPGASANETVIRPASGWQLINLQELWHFRELLYFLIWRDVKVRYKQTLLGVAWSVLQPAMMMVVFSLFFARVAHFEDASIAYPVFVLCGLLPWTFFSTALTAAGNSVIGSERLITKVYFPRLTVPFAAVGSALFDFLLSYGLLFVVMLIYQTPPGWTVLLTPAIMAVIALATAGFGTLFAALNVAYRDVRYVIPFMVQLWIFATPAVYMPMQTKEPSGWLQVLLALNPLNALVAAFRAAVLGTAIDWAMLAASAVLAVLIFLIGCLYFRRVEDSFVDMI